MNKEPFYSFVLFDDEQLLSKIMEYFMNIDWQQDTYIIHGKKVTPKRKTFMYGVDYSYSGIKKNAVPFDKQVSYIANHIEKRMNLPYGYFNACLLNLYEDGDTYLSYHKDDEPEMDRTAPIVSFSIGATRKFYLKNDSSKEVKKFEHKAGEILVMKPKTQEDWTHSIPKEKKVVEPRISLTFRRFIV